MAWHRLITIPGFLAAWLLWIAAAPIWAVLSVLVDGMRRGRGLALRSALLVAVYLTCELLGIAAGSGLWVWRKIFGIDDERWLDLHFRLEAWWGATLFRSVVLLFSLRVEVEGDADLGRGPYLMLSRHTSSGDTLLAAAIVSRPYGIRMRYVLKRENLWDPCLDIVGNRLPNIFVDRFSGDSASEIERLRRIARDLGADDGVLIYPEGTRFSTEKRNRVIERLRNQGDERMHEYAMSLANVLPPRLGGTLGLLDEAPEMDVIFCSHAGFENAASLAKVWSGAFVNQTIRVRFDRIPRSKIPEEHDVRVAWLLEEWRRVDSWVGDHQ